MHLKDAPRCVDVPSFKESFQLDYGDGGGFGPFAPNSCLKPVVFFGFITWRRSWLFHSTATEAGVVQLCRVGILMREERRGVGGGRIFSLPT